MKKILKIGLSIVGILYLAVIIFVTGCLLFYNQYKVTQINDKTFIIIDDKSDMYKDGDLVIFKKNANDDIKSGDEIFFYEVTNGEVNIVSGKVTKSEKITDKETTFTINGNHEISSESVIGKTITASTYPSVGKVLYIFESRFGFLLLVILPALLFFFYEIYRLVMDIKSSKKEGKELSVENETVQAPTEAPAEEVVAPVQAPTEAPAQEVVAPVQAPAEAPAQEVVAPVQTPAPAGEVVAPVQAPAEAPAGEVVAPVQAPAPAQEVVAPVQAPAPAEEVVQAPAEDVINEMANIEIPEVADVKTESTQEVKTAQDGTAPAKDTEPLAVDNKPDNLQ